MNFIGEIGNLTLPQIQEYLSGQRPFPGGQMALAAHMPALAAQAVRLKMKDGGEVPQLSPRMQALLMQRFAVGGEAKPIPDQQRYMRLLNMGVPENEARILATQGVGYSPELLSNVDLNKLPPAVFKELTKFSVPTAPKEPAVAPAPVASGRLDVMDAEGNVIGERSPTDPKLVGEASFKDAANPRGLGVGFYNSKNGYANSTARLLEALDAKDNVIGLRLSSSPLFEGEVSARPARSVPYEYKDTVGKSLDDVYSMATGPFVGAYEGVTSLGGKIADNYRRQQALRDAAKAAKQPINPTDILNAIGEGDTPAAAAENPAAATPDAAQGTPEQQAAAAAAKVESDRARAIQTLYDSIRAGREGAAAPALNLPKITMPNVPDLDTKDVMAALRDRIAKTAGSTPENQMAKYDKMSNYTDRTPERMAALEGIKSGLEEDRELGKWMAVGQFAAGMAGKRNIAEGMAGGLEKGLPAFAASQAAYRKGMNEATFKKMQIEDAADTLNRERAKFGIDADRLDKADNLKAIQDMFGVNAKVAEQILNKAKVQQEAQKLQLGVEGLRLQAQQIANQSEYQQAGARLHDAQTAQILAGFGTGSGRDGTGGTGTKGLWQAVNIARQIAEKEVDANPPQVSKLERERLRDPAAITRAQQQLRETAINTRMKSVLTALGLSDVFNPADAAGSVNFNQLINAAPK